jgi:hypothetical protein
LPTLAQLGDLQLNAVTLICLALIMGAAWIVGALSLEAVYWYQLRLEEKEVFGPNYQYRRVVNNEDEVAIMSEREIEE